MPEKEKERVKRYPHSYFVKCQSCGRRTHVSVQGHDCIICNGPCVQTE